MPVYGTFRTQLGIAVEPTPGTPAGSPTRWIPATTYKPEDKIPQYADKALRGLPAETFGHYQLTAEPVYAVDGPAYPDVFGYWPFGIYGLDTIQAAPSSATQSGSTIVGATSITLTSATGYVAGMAVLIDTGANQEGNLILSVATNTLTLIAPLRFAHSAATVTGNTMHQFQGANVPKTYTLWDFYGPNWRQYAYGCVEEVAVKWAANSEVTYSTKMRNWLSTVPSTPTPSFVTVPPFIGWQSGFAVAGTTQNNLESLDFTLKRALKPIFGPGSQNPINYAQLTIAVTGKATLQASTDAEYNLFRNASVSSGLKFGVYGPAIGAQGVSTASGMMLQVSTPAYVNAAPERGQGYTQWMLDFEADYSATDAGPGMLFLTNAITGQYS